MSTIKVNELATSAISLTDFFVKANSAGLANKNTIQEMSNFLGTIGSLGLRGVLLAADAAVALDGIYIAGDTGTYTNNGGLVVDVSNQIVLITITGTQTVFAKAEIPITLTIDATVIEGSANAVSGDAVFNNSNKSVKTSSIKANNNVFRAGATGSDIGELEQFFLEIEAISGFTESTRYYLREFKVDGAGYKIGIRDSNNASVLEQVFSYTPPTDNFLKAKDVVTWSHSGVSIKITFDWNKFITVVYNTTSLASHELSNNALFGRKVTERDTLIDTNTANIIVNSNENTATRNLIGIDNKLINVVSNADFSAGWIYGGASTVANGVVYMPNSDFDLYQNNLTISKPIGTKFVFTAKMKSIASTDYYFQVRIDYSDASYDAFLIYKNTDDSFLRTDGYYQLLKYFTTTKAVVNINVSIKASLAQGNINYNANEGVFLTEPYISSYADGEEDYFLLNNYFPLARIIDWSSYSLIAQSLTPSYASSISASIVSSVVDLFKKFKTDIFINMLGDSFTALGYDENRGFIDFTSKYLGLDRLTNFGGYGIGGTRIANNSTTTTDSNAMVNRFSVMPNSDALCIMGGYNDNQTPFSNWTDKLGSSSTLTDTNTIWGAYSTIITGYKALYPYTNSSVALMTYPWDANDANKIALNQTIRDIASYYNLPLLDFHKLCGFKKDLNCDLNRTSLTNGLTYINGSRIRYNQGFIIDTDATWSYAAEYIAVDTSVISTIGLPINANVLQYSYDGSNYTWLETSSIAGRDAILLPNCTHLRFNVQISNQSEKFTILDGEFVTDGVHPNIIGFRDKMAPVFTDFLTKILKRK